MKKRGITLLLALALVLSLCAVTAAAGEKAEEKTASQRPEAAVAENGGTGEETPAEEAAEEEASSLAGPDAEPETDPKTGEVIETATIEPDAVGTVSFANVERRMREKNLSILMLDQSIETLKDIDYKKIEDDMRDGLNEIADKQLGIINGGGFEPIGSNLALASMQQQYDALKEQFDAVRNGDLQEDNAGLIRQLKNGQDQIVLAGESTYIALAALETQEAALQRQLAALNRTVEELELRYQMGQVSALQLKQAKAGRTQLTSGLQTLRMNIRNLKYQFEMLLGAEQTGEIALGAVPEVTDKELAAMDVEKDLLDYKAKSYDLYAAAKTLEDAQETYKDDAKEYHYNEEKAEFRSAKRTWQAAQYTYNDTVQTCELKFRTLYAQVQDYKQIYDAAKVSLECEKASCAAAQLRYEQGTISANALLDAKDSLQEAEEKVKTASNDLFSSYNTYRWAVEHGVLN